MAVRRLAEPALQPKSFAFTAENLDWAKGQIARYPEGRQASAIIPILWRAQEQEGWVTIPQAISPGGPVVQTSGLALREIGPGAAYSPVPVRESASALLPAEYRPRPCRQSPTPQVQHADRHSQRSRCH